MRAKVGDNMKKKIGFEYHRRSAEKEVLNIKYIYSFKNRGAGASRDDAINVSQNDFIVFIDSDIVIPPSFIDNHLLVHLAIPKDNVVVSFRENVPPKDRRIFGRVKWIHGDLMCNDHRTNLLFKKEWVVKPSDNKLVGRNFKILEKTNFFKEFGFGRKIAVWSLPMMVLTCAMSAPARLVKKAIPTPKGLFGWGFNDTCMAVKLIAYGAKIIPNLNSTVIHILEKTHVKATNIKNREYLNNEKVYQKLLRQSFYE